MPNIMFKFNHEKTIEALLYILSKRDHVNVYHLLKSLFAADKFHLNKYLRPVTGDKYKKMPYGTVPVFVFDLINQDFMTLASYNIDEVPFEKISKTHFIKKTRDFDKSLLSESDIEALDFGVSEYLDLSFTDVKKKNHLENCWLTSDDNAIIPFEKMIDDPDVLDALKEFAGFEIAV